jgi:tRNA-dihydrouridine synthase
VIANGDIVDKESAKKCLEITKAAGVMVGRALLRKKVGEIRELFYNNCR